MPGKSAANKILAAIRAVPRGQVAGYGESARGGWGHGRERMVAGLLSTKEDTELPWHRILRSDGRIAVPLEDAQFSEQQQRLRAEGVIVRNGRVQGQRAAASLDEILWAPEK